MLTDAKNDLALGLLSVGCVKFGSFKLKLHEKNPNAPLSPIYIDLRLLRSFPKVMGKAVAVYRDLTAGLSFDCYADVPTAATPIVAILTYETGVPMISPRLDAKGHGITRKIDGAFKPGHVALLVDDLITKADSKLDAIAVLRENGVDVKDVAVLVDREQGGADELARHGHRCHSAFKLTELLSFYLSANRISQEDYDRTVTYLQDNKA